MNHQLGLALRNKVTSGENQPNNYKIVINRLADFNATRKRLNPWVGGNLCHTILFTHPVTNSLGQTPTGDVLPG